MGLLGVLGDLLGGGRDCLLKSLHASRKEISYQIMTHHREDGAESLLSNYGADVVWSLEGGSVAGRLTALVEEMLRVEA